MLSHRQNNVLKATSGATTEPQFAASYTVTVFPVGAVASGAASGTTLNVDAGHSMAAGDKVLIWDGTTGTYSGSNSVNSTTATTIVMSGGTYSTAVGNLIVNLGPDTGTSAPTYNNSKTPIYSDMDGGTAETNSRVTTDATGNYAYWHRGDGRMWELIRDASGTVAGVVPGRGGVADRLNAYDYGVSGDGSTDDASALQAVFDAAGDGIAFFPAGTYLTNSVLEVQTGTSVQGSGIDTVFKAGASLPTTHTSGADTFDAPVLFFDKTTSTKISKTELFMVDGNSVARNGLVISGGADHKFSTIRVQNTTVNAYVMDGCQNFLFEKLFTFQIGNRSYYIINGTYNCSFVACDSRSSSAADLEAADDANYPRNGDLPGIAGMEECIWTGGIFEDAVTSKTHCVLMTKGKYNTFVGTQFEAGDVTTAAVQHTSNADNNLYLHCRFIGAGVEKPAIIEGGLENVNMDCSFTTFGTSTLVDLIEVSTKTSIIRPFFNTNINVTGKHIVNKAGTSSTLVTYETVDNAGSTGSRPTDDVDANYNYWDATLNKLITWEFVSNEWRDQSGGHADVPTYSDGDTTPSVQGPADFVWEIANTGATTITAFDDIAANQRITCIFKDGNTTIAENAVFHLTGGVNFNYAAGDVAVFVKEATSPFLVREILREIA